MGHAMNAYFTIIIPYIIQLGTVELRDWFHTHYFLIIDGSAIPKHAVYKTNVESNLSSLTVF